MKAKPYFEVFCDRELESLSNIHGGENIMDRTSNKRAGSENKHKRRYDSTGNYGRKGYSNISTKLSEVQALCFCITHNPGEV